MIVDLLPAHRAALAGMGVEARRRRSAGGDAEVGDQRAVGDAQRRLEQVRASARRAPSARARWMVTGTTRSAGRGQHHHRQRRAGECARNSVWPGKAKPAPSISACLWIGLVQSASAAPPRTSSTPRAIMATTAAAFAGSGRPGTAGPRQRVRQHRQAVGRRRPRRRRRRSTRRARRGASPRRRMWSGSPIRKKPSRPPQRRPGRERDLAADPGRVAEGQRHRQGHRSTIRASPISSWR